MKISLIFKITCSEVGRTGERLRAEASFSKAILLPGAVGAVIPPVLLRSVLDPEEPHRSPHQAEQVFTVEDLPLTQ